MQPQNSNSVSQQQNTPAASKGIYTPPYNKPGGNPSAPADPRLAQSVGASAPQPVVNNQAGPNNIYANLKQEDIDRINEVMARWSGNRDYHSPNVDPMAREMLPVGPIIITQTRSFNKLAYSVMVFVILIALLLLADLKYRFILF